MIWLFHLFQIMDSKESLAVPQRGAGVQVPQTNTGLQVPRMGGLQVPTTAGSSGFKVPSLGGEKKSSSGLQVGRVIWKEL